MIGLNAAERSQRNQIFQPIFSGKGGLKVYVMGPQLRGPPLLGTQFAFFLSDPNLGDPRFPTLSLCSGDGCSADILHRKPHQQWEVDVEGVLQVPLASLLNRLHPILP